MRTILLICFSLLAYSLVSAQKLSGLAGDDISERLPDWLRADNPLTNRLEYKTKYAIDDRMKPLYLQADFDGDGYLDIAVPIKNKQTQSLGFAIVHGNTRKVHIIGAGVQIKNGNGNNLDFIDLWQISREKSYEPGVDENTGTGPEGELIIDLPTLQIEKSEIGGGQIYWNGEEYAYFHQTC